MTKNRVKHKIIAIKAKPMRKKSKLEKKSQRAADGENVVWNLKLNGLSRAARNGKSRRCREPNPLSIRHVCQYMGEWTFSNVKLSGTAIIKDFITVSS